MTTLHQLIAMLERAKLHKGDCVFHKPIANPCGGVL